MDEGLQIEPAKARTLLREILESGTLRYSKHCQEQMGAREITTLDLVNVLRAGKVEPSESEKGSWRHRVKTARLGVVVVLVSETEAVVVTAWRMGR